MENNLTFEQWWEQFKAICVKYDYTIDTDSPESYRNYYDDEYNPEDAVDEERSYFEG